MKVIWDPRCLEYRAPGHPESPQRLAQAYEFLSDPRLGHEFVPAEPASDEDLLRVHTPKHIEDVKHLRFSDPDSPRYPGIFEYARLSAGAAIQAMRLNGFSLMRPPGHHAARERVAGFCYFNNIAIAVKASGQKTLIVDIDGHHGDGTQAIFLGDPQVVYISLHSFPNYPGTGLRSEQNCYNYPLPFHCGDALYLRTLGEALESIDLTGIEQVAISAGFDTYHKDPLASLGLTTECYERIGRRLRALGLPTFAVLEGGYCVEDLGKNIHALLRGLS
ncbi:MAG: histone deacetylase [Candidatus Bipolaricaulota bacterium]|nr:histone deacetylase [Candidatus Bipolaricaulota bacterium]MCS7273872.1 histone deacetylase [Candidatus Bipolaricaulota bacterium]MDW8110710.1 histone deacetylase [Candidatus Bipolaricaulota bacterium]MDW8328432.1 histone deacetylase [Candidatus Bipolaricaulota bacterium]